MSINLLIYKIIGAGWTIWTLTIHPNVDLILNQYQLRGEWLISPNGDKIVYEGADYNNRRYTFLKIISTNQQYTIDSQINDACDFVEWLDDINLYCVNNHQTPYILATDDFTLLPLEKVNTKEIEAISLITKADKIYRFVNGSSLETLILVSFVQGKSYMIVDVENADSLLQGYSNISFVRQSAVAIVRDKIYSPDTLYYYCQSKPVSNSRTALSLAIFETENNRKLADYVTDAVDFRAQWAGDSSGVFFEPINGGIWGGPEGKLRKLNVPGF